MKGDRLDIVLSMHWPGNGCELSTWPMLGQHAWVLSSMGCICQCATVSYWQ